MTDHDADLLAIREVLAARAAAGEEALSRTWTTIGARLAAPERGTTVHRSHRWLVPVGAAAAVSLLSLGGGLMLTGTDDQVPAGPQAFPLITDPDEIVFPLDEYDFTAESYQSFDAATEHLQWECLRRFGYGGERPGSPGPLPESPGHQRRGGTSHGAVAAMSLALTELAYSAGRGRGRDQAGRLRHGDRA